MLPFPKATTVHNLEGILLETFSASTRSCNRRLYCIWREPCHAAAESRCTSFGSCVSVSSEQGAWWCFQSALLLSRFAACDCAITDLPRSPWEGARHCDTHPGCVAPCTRKTTSADYNPRCRVWRLHCSCVPVFIGAGIIDRRRGALWKQLEQPRNTGLTGVGDARLQDRGGCPASQRCG